MDTVCTHPMPFATVITRLSRFPRLHRIDMLLHNAPMKPDAWIKSLPGNPSITAAARAAGIQKTTLIRQLDRGTVSAENVIEIARAYDVSPVDALVATGHLRADEVKIVGVELALGYATNHQLLGEVNDRVDPDGRRLFHEGGITPHFDSDSSAGTVTSLRRYSNSPDDDVEPLRYVADSSPDEPEMGDDGFHDGP